MQFVKTTPPTSFHGTFQRHHNFFPKLNVFFRVGVFTKLFSPIVSYDNTYTCILIYIFKVFFFRKKPPLQQVSNMFMMKQFSHHLVEYICNTPPPTTNANGVGGGWRNKGVIAQWNFDLLIKYPHVTWWHFTQWTEIQWYKSKQPWSADQGTCTVLQCIAPRVCVH